MRDPVGRRAGGVFAFLDPREPLTRSRSRACGTRAGVVEHRLESTASPARGAIRDACCQQRSSAPVREFRATSSILPLPPPCNSALVFIIGRKRRHLSAICARPRGDSRPDLIRRGCVSASLKSLAAPPNTPGRNPAREPGREVGVRSSAGGFVRVLGALALVAATTLGCADTSWEGTQRANTVAAYTRFLRDNPDSAAREGRRRANRLPARDDPQDDRGYEQFVADLSAQLAHGGAHGCDGAALLRARPRREHGRGVSAVPRELSRTVSSRGA